MGTGGQGVGRGGGGEVGDVKERKLASMVLPVSISIAPKSRIINAFFRGTLKFWNRGVGAGDWGLGIVPQKQRDLRPLRSAPRIFDFAPRDWTGSPWRRARWASHGGARHSPPGLADRGPVGNAVPLPAASIATHHTIHTRLRTLTSQPLPRPQPCCQRATNN